jgi:PAS domain S-box-containing protein
MKYQSLTENSPDLIARFDRQYRHLYVNAACASAGHYTPEEHIGKTMGEVGVPAEVTRMWERHIRNVFETGQVVDEEDCLKKLPGLKYQAKFVPEFADDGSTHSVQVIARDITNHKQAEEALRQSERRLSSIYDTVGDIIYYLAVEADTNYRFISVNKAFCKVTGLSEGMVVGKLVNEVIPEPSLSIVLEKYRQAIKENSIIRWEETSDYPTGRKVGDVSISPVFDDKGRCTYLVRSVHDITERKLAEEKEKHLNSILSAIRNVDKLITKEKGRNRLLKGSCDNLVATRGFNSSWIVTLDETARPVYLSEAGSGKSSVAFKEMFDRGDLPQCAKTALARPGIVIVNDVADQCAGCPNSSSCKGNAAFCVRLEKDGKIHGILCTSIPHAFADDLREQTLFMEIGEDIAFALYNIELKENSSKMELELKSSEARYRTLFENTTEGILINEKQTGKFNYTNPAMCQILGYTADELKQLTVTDIHPDDVLERIMSEFAAHEQENKSMIQHDIACLKKDGTIIYTDVVTTPKILIDGTFHSATFFINITEKKKAEDEKKKLEEQLWQSQKMEAIGRLSGGIAHDFNNMLTTIIGNAEMALMETGKEDPLREVIEDIKLAGEKAAVLTRQLLAFSRKQILQTEIFNLNQVVAEMDKMLRRLIGEDIKLETNLAPDLGLVETDPGQIEQIIMNLAINAKDAMPEGGRLTIETASVELDEGYVRSHFPMIPGRYEMISVSDTGIGMSKEIQAQIFEPFYTTKVKGKGTGLGLSIVYGIVKQSNGYVWVYSEPGKGATFKIYLPRVEKNAGDHEKSDKRPQKSLRGSETIMVVEDDAMIMKMIKKVLTNCGYTVLCAADGNEALRVSDEHKGLIHLILTDVIMPGMGGRELAEQLEKTRPDTKLIYMSGYTDNAVVHHGALEKGLSFIQKPFTSHGLSKKVREMLED